MTFLEGCRDIADSFLSGPGYFFPVWTRNPRQHGGFGVFGTGEPLPLAHPVDAPRVLEVGHRSRDDLDTVIPAEPPEVVRDVRGSDRAVPLGNESLDGELDGVRSRQAPGVMSTDPAVPLHQLIGSEERVLSGQNDAPSLNRPLENGDLVGQQDASLRQIPEFRRHTFGTAVRLVQFRLHIAKQTP